jgi:hypothetical protein
MTCEIPIHERHQATIRVKLPPTETTSRWTQNARSPNALLKRKILRKMNKNELIISSDKLSIS